MIWLKKFLSGRELSPSQLQEYTRYIGKFRKIGIEVEFKHSGFPPDILGTYTRFGDDGSGGIYESEITYLFDISDPISFRSEVIKVLDNWKQNKVSFLGGFHANFQQIYVNRRFLHNFVCYQDDVQMNYEVRKKDFLHKSDLRASRIEHKYGAPFLNEKEFLIHIVFLATTIFPKDKNKRMRIVKNSPKTFVPVAKVYNQLSALV